MSVVDIKNGLQKQRLKTIQVLYPSPYCMCDITVAAGSDIITSGSSSSNSDEANFIAFFKV